MDELVKLVQQKTGISEDAARTAVQTVIDQLKQRLPAPLAGQIDNVLKSGSGGDLGKLAGDLGGMFGRK